MIQRTFGQIVRMVGGSPSGAAQDALAIRGVSTDSRTIQPGNLFIPLDVGVKFDGHDFVRSALENGAAAALWQSDRPIPPDAEGWPLIVVPDTMLALQQLASAYIDELNVRVLGITGSNGKTTTKDIAASILKTAFKTNKTIGNLNSHIGLPQTILKLEEDTEAVVLEMGMRGRGEIDLLTRIAKPHAAIITIVGEAHLERLGSREEIARAKTEIVAGLRPGGLFVYPGDEPLIPQVLPEMPQPESMQRITFGPGPGAGVDLYPVDVRPTDEGTYFRLNDVPETEFYLPAPGRHNVQNAIAAIAVARHFGMADRQIAQGLKELELTGMRFETVQTAGGVTVLNDAYNASPASMKAAIRLLHERTGTGRKAVVLGDMLELGADAEADYHRQVGAELDPARIDKAFTYGNLARHIADATAERLGSGRVNAYEPEQKSQLIRDLIEYARPGDTVLVKGSRGMMLEEVVQALVQAQARPENVGEPKERG